MRNKKLGPFDRKKNMNKKEKSKTQILVTAYLIIILILQIPISLKSFLEVLPYIDSSNNSQNF
tara:strand:+ start:270 stop:458 length:189 start_codon:yes stop_codon:yes gene_type:complete